MAAKAMQKTFKKRKKKKKKNRNIRKIALSYEAIAPAVLSLTKNTAETVNYFSEIINYTLNGNSSRKEKKIIHFDLSGITELTIDAIMYLIAIIHNIKRKMYWEYEFKGNFPKNLNVNKQLVDCGFLKFFSSDYRGIARTKSDNITIETGSKSEPLIAKQICDYVNNVLGTQRVYTRFLYNILIELMTNTKQHAYNNSDKYFSHKWYIFVENVNHSIKFIFLDIGDGIPKTIRKKFTEKFIENMDKIFNKPILSLEDNEYILSALEGHKRSQTKLPYRGKGLPKIYQYYIDNNIHNLKIMEYVFGAKMNNMMTY